MEIASGLVLENVGVRIVMASTVSMTFFTLLRRVGSLTMLGSIQSNLGQSLSSIKYPGMVQLEQTQNMILNDTGFIDLTDFSNLKCIGSMQFLKNQDLRSLAGLENARLITQGPGISVLVQGNGLLVSVQNVTSLRTMAGCEAGSNTTGPTGGFFMDNVCPKPIESWVAFCRVWQFSRCADN